jgi:hypothetical protein
MERWIGYGRRALTALAFLRREASHFGRMWREADRTVRLVYGVIAAEVVIGLGLFFY